MSSGGEAQSAPWAEPRTTSSSSPSSAFVKAQTISTARSPPPLTTIIATTATPTTNASSTTTTNTGSTTAIAGGDGEESRERRKLKNEDSSYDSDFDPCESSSSPRGGGGGQDSHEDVSRTASETLAAEFEDYVTYHRPQGPNAPCRTSVCPLIVSSSSSSVTPVPPPALTVTEATPQPISMPPGFPFGPPSTPTSKIPPQTPSTSSETLEKQPEDTASSAPPVTHSIASVVGSADYPQQVEFGVKLGYSESLVQLALTKLGSNPDKNELLDELIRLGAGAPSKSDCEDDAPVEGDESEQHQQQQQQQQQQPSLRPIIIDGSNVAMSHGNKVKFSCKGIRLCVDWFRARGHKEILVFVPMWRKEQSRFEAIITDQDVLQELEKEGVLSFTPSRSCSGKRIVSYDDRYIIKEALKSDGVIVSNDNYRDLANENPAYRKVIETSLLMYSWVNGRFEPPDDPLGRNGPSLDVFLRKPAVGSASTVIVKDSRDCPYGRKCTYGNKCKYTHPERGAAPVKSVTELLQEQMQKHYQDKAKSRDSSPGESLRAKSLSLPVSSSESGGTKKALTRTQSTFPAVSVSQTAVTKEGNIIEYPSKMSSGSSDSPCSTVHTPASTKSSLDSIRTSLMKGDSSLFTICPSQMNFRPNLSWPDQESAQSNQPSKVALPFSQQEATSAENLHPKLQRQLSINPVSDDRLPKISKQYMESPSTDLGHISSFSMHQQTTQQKQTPHQLLQPLGQQQSQSHRLLESEAISNRSCIGTRCISPGPVFSHGYANRDMMSSYLHPPLSRHSSSQETKPLSAFSQHMLPPCFHNPVGRNLSAPDQIRGGGGQGQQHHQNIIPHITRLNSTSDSRLNLHGSSNDPQQFVPDYIDDSCLSRISCPQMPLSTISSSSLGPIGSRPMSPQQPLTGMITPGQLPSSPRMHQHVTSSNSLGHQLAGNNTHEDERLKIFYHLSQLFPEAQVRGALARNPEETDPKKICMAILSMSGCRPVSPQQQMTGSGLSLPGFGSNLSLLGSSFATSLNTSAASHDAVRESARMEAYSKLSKLFPEEQVMSVLLRNPEETDPTKLCMYLMAANSQS